ncbi:MAG TPA: NlpC/P60 family protein [Armatimonadota bacterium]|nr:NlpC/P60 family protein [Armatimonadota bacterium]
MTYFRTYSVRPASLLTGVLVLASLAMSTKPAATCVGVVLEMLVPPEDETTQYVGSTSGTEENRWFYKAFVVGTTPSTDGLTVTVHLNAETATASGLGSGTYTTGNWDVTKKRSPGTVYATAPGAEASGDATIHWKKNRQLITCAPDFIGHPYVWNANGPDAFDCSGFQYWLYKFVGVDNTDRTAQGFYDASDHPSEANLLPGDWIFFDWGSSPPSSSSIDHTGVYETTSGGWKVMIHAANPDDDVERRTFTQYYEDHSDGLYGELYGTNERF